MANIKQSNSVHLILGGARSGKSRFAEQIAQQHDDVLYMATAQPLDDEMSHRIAHHQRSRPSKWQTIEQPLHLAEALKQVWHEPKLILIDCLTLWLNNWLHQHQLEEWTEQKNAFLSVISQPRNWPVLVVSNEVGQGIVPLGELSRAFVDQAGWLHQDIAQVAKKVDFIVAGLPLHLKGDDK